MIPPGAYRYEIRRLGDLIAIEEATVTGEKIIASRQPADGLSQHQVEVMLDSEGRVNRVEVRYSSSLFNRRAVYDAVEEDFRGNVSALVGRNEIVIKLGRFREVDVAGLTIFRALIIAHIRAREQTRWTGRVAVIDSATLVAASLKQNCARLDDVGRSWRYEARMGDVEEIKLDEINRVVTRRDANGQTSVLVEAHSAC